MCDTKKCSKCGEVKGLDLFPKHKGRRDGLDSRCKQCALTAAHAYRLANLEKVREKDRARVAILSTEQKRVKHKQWRDGNLDYVRAVGRATAANLYSQNPDKYRELSAAWREKNHDRAIAGNRAQRESLARGYVAQLLAMSAQSVPPDLLALKREQLAIKRMARELKKAATKPTGESK